MNICGVLVHAVPLLTDSVADALQAIDGVDVHQQADGGRIVVTVEDTPRSAAIDTLRNLQRLDGVVASSLIYHHFEPDDVSTPSERPRLEQTKSWPGKSYA